MRQILTEAAAADRGGTSRWPASAACHAPFAVGQPCPVRSRDLAAGGFENHFELFALFGRTLAGSSDSLTTVAAPNFHGNHTLRWAAVMSVINALGLGNALAVPSLGSDSVIEAKNARDESLQRLGRTWARGWPS